MGQILCVKKVPFRKSGHIFRSTETKATMPTEDNSFMNALYSYKHIVKKMRQIKG